jgi:hypothetical protein
MILSYPCTGGPISEWMIRCCGFLTVFINKFIAVWPDLVILITFGNISRFSDFFGNWKVLVIYLVISLKVSNILVIGWNSTKYAKWHNLLLKNSMRTGAGLCLQSCTSKLEAVGPSCPDESTETCWSPLALCWLRARAPGLIIAIRDSIFAFCTIAIKKYKWTQVRKKNLLPGYYFSVITWYPVITKK